MFSLGIRKLVVVGAIGGVFVLANALFIAHFLCHVPILEGVPLDIQIDLLADVWLRQHQRKLIEANLLDAAIVYAVCEEAIRLMKDEPSRPAICVGDGPVLGVNGIISAATTDAKELECRPLAS